MENLEKAILLKENIKKILENKINSKNTNKINILR
jgi:hypothetical protein